MNSVELINAAIDAGWITEAGLPQLRIEHHKGCAVAARHEYETCDCNPSLWRADDHGGRTIFAINGQLLPTPRKD